MLFPGARVFLIKSKVVIVMTKKELFFATCSTCWLTYIPAHAETLQTPTQLCKKAVPKRVIIIIIHLHCCMFRKIKYLLVYIVENLIILFIINKKNNI